MAAVIWARYPVIAAVVLVLAAKSLCLSTAMSMALLQLARAGVDQRQFCDGRGGDRDDTCAMMREMQRATEALGKDYEERYGTNPLDFVMAEIGGNAGRGIAGTDSKDASLLGAISIELIDADLRPYSSAAFVGELQDDGCQTPACRNVSFRRWGTGPGGDALDIQI